ASEARDGPARDADLRALVPEVPSMAQGAAGLGLPLMHHLVQQGPGGPGPPVALEVTMREGDFGSLAGAGRGTELSQPPPHPAGKPERAGTQGAAEVPGVELGVEGAEPGQRGLVLGAG